MTTSPSSSPSSSPGELSPAGLDFSPAPEAAATLHRVRLAASMETRLLLRNGEQLLLALVIPLAVLVAGRLFPERLGVSFSQIAPSVLGLAIWSTAFTAVAISTGFDRRYGVLERLAATPLGRTGLILGKALATVGVSLGQVIVLAAVSLALGWRPQLDGAGLAVAIVAIPAAATACVALALSMASILRAEITLALANLVHLGLAALGALVLPASDYGPAAPLVRLLPTAALGESLRQALASTPASGGLLFPLVVALVWAAAAVLLTRKVIRWTS